MAGDTNGNVAAHEGAVLPPGVEGVFREFRTCEFSTLARDGTPITWPLVTLWRPEKRHFVQTTSIGMPQKAFNIRRDPLLFSDPPASGLRRTPAVLVQGEAEAPDEIRTSPNHPREYWTRLFKIQRAGKVYGSNRLMRYLMDWYYMRLYIHVRPRRILFWPEGDFARAPLEAEVDHVG